MALQDATIAGHAASASSARQPGSFDQLTGSKRTVGAGGERWFLARGYAGREQRDCCANAIRLMNVITIEVRPLLLGNGECPHYSLMPAWSMMKAYCSAYSRKCS